MSEEYHENVKFSALKKNQSLQDTNIRSKGSVDQFDSSIRVLKGGDPIHWMGKQENKTRSDYGSYGHSYQTEDIHHVYRNYNDGNAETTQETQLFENLEISSRHPSESLTEEAAFQNETQDEEYFEQKASKEAQSEVADSPPEGPEAQHKEANAPIAFVPHSGNDKMENDDTVDDPDCHRRGNIRRKEADCGGDANMSVQMYRYLQHNDLKRQIEDITKRENTFVSKHCWNEALRLREMRNELILLKNKNLYDNHDLQIDDETRQSGLGIIEAREGMRKKRMRISDSMLYSDEAKNMWVQWSREDEAIAQTETNGMRDLLLDELENEWANVALRDKNRISQLKDRITVNCGLQDEHKLAAVIQAANDRQKQYMNYLAT